MDRKSFSCKFKFDEEKRTFTGFLSTYGNRDKGGDVVRPGAFAKTLADNSAGLPLLWSHDQTRPIGKAELSDSQKGLRIKGKLLEGIRAADETYRLLKAGIVRGLSFGYDAVKTKYVGDVRHLLEVKLYEASLVTLPMNERAVVEAVKSSDSVPSELKAAVEAFLSECKRF